MSSWSAFKISTDLFSKGLMNNSKDWLQQMIEDLGLNVNPQLGDGSDTSFCNKLDPKAIMGSAFDDVVDPGSSTCCIAVLNQNILDIANLGDSGFMVFEYKYEKGRYKVFLKEK